MWHSFEVPLAPPHPPQNCTGTIAPHMLLYNPKVLGLCELFSVCEKLNCNALQMLLLHLIHDSKGKSFLASAPLLKIWGWISATLLMWEPSHNYMCHLELIVLMRSKWQYLGWWFGNCNQNAIGGVQNGTIKREHIMLLLKETFTGTIPSVGLNFQNHKMTGQGTWKTVDWFHMNILDS